MDEQPENQDMRARQLRAFRWATPIGVGVTYVLAAAQGAEPRHALLLASIMLVGCFAAAGLIHLRGSRAGNDAAWIATILRMLTRR